MKIAPLAEVKTRLSAILEECEKEGPVIITRNGKAVAVLVAPRSDADVERLIVAYSPTVQSLAKTSAQTLQQDATPLNLTTLSIEERKQLLRKRLMEAGVLLARSEPDRSKQTNWKPIATLGKPASQQIIEERR